MEQKPKNILIFAASSDIGRKLTEKLLSYGHNIYATSRKHLDFEHLNLKNFILDLSKEENIDDFFTGLNGVEFDCVVNFQGVAISSPVECLKQKDLEFQLNISLYSLLAVLKNLKNKLNPNAKVINISSMAAFGLFPFLSPYSIAKASADILLNCYEIETGIKTVSVKPGVVGTKFWEYCVKQNKESFETLPNEYALARDFLKDNALKNSNKGLKPEEVSDLIFKIIKSKNPKSSYTIGADSKFTAIASLFKGRKLFAMIRKILNYRIAGYINGK